MPQLPIEQAAIEQRIAELGRQISEDYISKRLTLMTVLIGGMFFAIDLARAITVPVVIDCIWVSSYGDSQVSSGEPILRKSHQTALEGADVLIVDDIFDTGLTLNHVAARLVQSYPASIRTCVMLSKNKDRSIMVEPDYVGFTIPDKFVYGYGLDYCGVLRNCTDIKVVDDAQG